MSAVFQSYPQEAGLIAACPVNGIPSGRKFAPAIAEAHEFFQELIAEALEFQKTLSRFGVCGRNIVFKDGDPARYDAVVKLHEKQNPRFKDLGLPFICHDDEMTPKVERVLDYWKQKGDA